MIAPGIPRCFCITARAAGSRRSIRARYARLVISTIVVVACTSAAFASPVLNTATVRNSEAYDSADFFDAYRAHLGKPVTESTAAEIAEAVRSKYVADGYARPGYAISDNGRTSGIVRIDIVEARISAIEYRGDAGPFRAQLEQSMGSLVSHEPLRPDSVADSLRYLRGLPGLEIGVSTRADAAQHGGIVLEVDAEFRRAEGTVKLSNRGTRDIGREVMFASMSGNGWFGFDNSAGVFITSAEDSDNFFGYGAFANGTFRESRIDWQLLGSFTSVAFETGGVLLHQDRDRLYAALTVPVTRRSQASSSFVAALDFDDLDVRQDDVTSRRDRLRSLEIGFSSTRRIATWQLRYSVDLERGFGLLGAGVENFLDPDDPRRHEFVIVRAHFVGARRLGEGWTFRWDAVGQESPQVLPSIKQFKVGGNRIGRGFEAAAVSGDRGIGTKFELKRRFARESNWLEALDVYGFYDIGAAWRNFGEAGRESAASAGLGITAQSGRFSGYIELAKPLTHADADGNRDATVFAEVSIDF